MKPAQGVAEVTGQSESLDKDREKMEPELQKPAGEALTVLKVKSPGELDLLEPSAAQLDEILTININETNISELLQLDSDKEAQEQVNIVKKGVPENVLELNFGSTDIHERGLGMGREGVGQRT